MPDASLPPAPASDPDEILHEERARAEDWKPSAHQVAFLAAYAATCSITRAASAAGIHRQTHYDWMRANLGYRLEFERAKEIAFDVLEEEAVRRAYLGVDEPVFHNGQQCGVIRKYSDRLMEVLLRGNKPKIYGDRRELTGKDGAPLLDLATLDRIIRDGDGGDVGGAD